MYGSKDLYLSRKMRYSIRTDNLAQVLSYKEYFYPRKKALGSDDLTELSGYLLDKRFGHLRPSEAHLRSSIEDVRDLLERAVKADDKNAVALYNMGRYYRKPATVRVRRPCLTWQLNSLKHRRHAARVIHTNS